MDKEYNLSNPSVAEEERMRKDMIDEYYDLEEQMEENYWEQVKDEHWKQMEEDYWKQMEDGYWKTTI